MKKFVAIAVPCTLILIVTFLIFFNTESVGNKLTYKPGNYLFLLEASPKENENETNLASFLIETDKNFNIIAKQENNYEYTGMIYDNQVIKLYSNINNKSLCLDIKNKKKKDCIINNKDLQKMSKIIIGLFNEGMYLKDNNINLKIVPEITFKEHNHQYFVVSGLQINR